MRCRPWCTDNLTVSTQSPALLVPPVRLGRLLGDARQTHGEDLDALVRRCGLAYEEEFFVEVEAGRAPLDESMVRWLTDLYGVEAGALVPARSHLVIDLNEGLVSVGDARLAADSSDPDRILTNYLALVYSLRGLPVGTPIPLRHVDLNVLGDALRLSSRDVSAALGQMMNGGTDQVRERARTLRRRVIVPVAGVLVGLTAVGGLLFVRSDGADVNGSTPTPSNPMVSAGAMASLDIGEAVVIERSSSTDPGGGQTVRGG
jgi:hypothetical protein